MDSPKEEVLKLLESMPKNATFEEIQYHIYVKEKVSRGLEDLKKSKTLTQKEVEKRAFRWIGK
jgi:hypothetical protein